MAEAFSDDRIQIFQDWIDGKLHHYPLGYDADKDARIIVGGFLATITARDRKMAMCHKRIEELRKQLMDYKLKIDTHKDWMPVADHVKLIADQTTVIERLRDALEPFAPTFDITVTDSTCWGIFLGGLIKRNFVDARQALDGGKE